MIALDSKSYPYLAVAQHYDIDYGEVLKFVDELENGFKPKLSEVTWIDVNKFNPCSSIG